MSTFRRLASGALASWARIGVNIATQVVLVPVYLKYWSPDQYGAWLALFALFGFINIVSVGYQNYLGAEFLQWVHKDREHMWALFFRALKMGVLISLGELSVILGIVVLGWQTRFIPTPNSGDASAIALTMVAYAISWCLCGSIGGLAVRVLSALGYFSRMAWWGVFSSVTLALAPLIAVVAGAGLAGAGLASAAAVLIYNLPFFFDMWQLMRREGLPDLSWHGAWAWREGLASLALALRGLMEMLRQQGVRLIIAPLAGTVDLAAFSTMRTGANVALQGVGSITQPLLPELMRFLHNRDQERSEASFASVWLVVVLVLAPGVLILQAVAPFLYGYWTLGRLTFDPLLFALFSLGVLVFASAQPAMAIVQGNNLLRPQLVAMILAGVIGVGGMILALPHFGLVGAGAALLAAEFVSAVCYTQVAAKWMRTQGLRWPRRSQLWVESIIAATTAGLISLARWPSFVFILVFVNLVVVVGLSFGYWRSLPAFARFRLSALGSKLRRPKAKWNP